MERFDVNDTGRLPEMVSAAERGEDVQIVRDGEVVAHLVRARDQLFQQIERLHATLPADVKAIDWRASLLQARRDD